MPLKSQIVTRGHTEAAALTNNSLYKYNGSTAFTIGEKDEGAFKTIQYPFGSCEQAVAMLYQNETYNINQALAKETQMCVRFRYKLASGGP